MIGQPPIDRPYLVVAELIKQDTWGGDFITKMKGLGSHEEFKNFKIGQSYELFGGSQLAREIFDSRDTNFTPSVGTAERDTSLRAVGCATFGLTDLMEQNREEVLGPNSKKFRYEMRLLLKTTDAQGNSYQLHLPITMSDVKWKSKPESWFFLQPGLITCGLKDVSSAKIDEYKVCCQAIESKMIELSELVKSGAITVKDARAIANDFIRIINPIQYVNVIKTDTHDVVDMSNGGVHHSWEQDSGRRNILMELQVDRKDSEATMRSYDNGKISDNGDVRPVTINEYFKYIDRTQEANDPSKVRRNTGGEDGNVFDCPDYKMDQITLKTDEQDIATDRSFSHVFVLEGAVKIKTKGGEVIVTRGNSCFVPYSAEKIKAKSIDGKKVVLLKSYV